MKLRVGQVTMLGYRDAFKIQILTDASRFSLKPTNIVMLSCGRLIEQCLR